MKKDAGKTKAQLINELTELRRKVTTLESADTERKQAEEALRESEDKFKSVFDYSVTGISVTRLSGEIAVNRAVCDILGYVREELDRRKWQQITHPDDVELSQKMIAVLLAGEQDAVRFTKRFIHKNGSVVWADLGAVLRRDLNGQPQYLITTLNDITDRKRAEEQLQQHARLLEEAVQQKQRAMEALFDKLLRQEKLATIGQMAGSIAHELRNPLGAVKQSIFYLKRLTSNQELTASNPKVLRHLNLMDTELNTSERVIADLLDMTRMKPLQRQPTDFRALAEDAIQRCHLPPQVRVNIVVEPEPLTIDVDPLQFRQVLLNVLTNAAQAIDGEGTITISAKQLTESGESVIEIRDTGSGIAPEALAKVFEPRYTTKANGTGLGLPICKEIIERHQGRISLTREPGEGTTVTIVLPRM